MPRNVLIKVNDLMANYVNKENPIKFEEILGSNALKMAQNREKPIGVKQFANLLKYTNDYWDVKPQNGRFTFEQRLKNNQMNFTSKEDFLNSFNINTKIETADAIMARESRSTAGPSRRSMKQK